MVQTWKHDGRKPFLEGGATLKSTGGLPVQGGSGRVTTGKCSLRMTRHFSTTLGVRVNDAIPVIVVRAGMPGDHPPVLGGRAKPYSVVLSYRNMQVAPATYSLSFFPIKGFYIIVSAAP